MLRVEIETKRGVIYKIVNLLNNKIYIGQTIQKIKNRFYLHCAKKCPIYVYNMPIHKAIRKYGKLNFSIEIIEEVSIKQLDEKEKYWINYYLSYTKGYNATLGGKSGHKPFKKLNINKIAALYKLGKSLRFISSQFNVDKQTIKNLLIRNNIELRTTRTYKLSLNDRLNIVEDLKSGLPRIQIMKKYSISKSYLSQLINGYRRI